tara:strand:- start:2399 stop:2761 length:363 start_codon:yes stop_codon:yes gene_type:complete
MSELYFTLKHDGGNHRVEIENQGDTTVIRFGASFTLRLDEENLNNLQMHLASAAREMCIERRDTSGVYSEADEIGHEDLEAASEVMQSLEMEMVQAGIDAREALKQKRIQEFNPNDPVNW